MAAPRDDAPPAPSVTSVTSMTPESSQVDDRPLDELLMGAARALRHHWADGLQEAGLSPHDARALRVVGRHGPCRLGVVAEHLRIAPRSVTDVVDRLEQRGLVERVPDPDDRRATTVRPTPTGEQVLSTVDAARRVGAAEFFGRLTDDERAALRTMLVTLEG
ncbi:MarR family winged helix-turn-helix transcriptional regulator [Terracoccus luteus]|jgi:DNA-binding MarR family transcriptional regulator|uniref:DNA-binding MarR family transcriptional regulator n=1 Tax=Terracoccus luteus TaxID=53356 RepID=A0A839PXV9_9MICO|nr:MarR family transcriptional regulator [Terracoccus luteus]MBB2987943.1 DNA-binding MarR family transcriptional regulator [Terracoccus luteus]MCP2173594.1 DNA-binding MarR family transcriptional regulator [Terracoccus luteus]